MPRITVQDLKEGMVLQEDVLDKKGRLILKKETEVTPKHIKIFKTWGVSMVSILGDKGEDLGEDKIESILADESVVAAIKEDLNAIFCHNDMDHPMIKSLYSACLQRSIVKKSRGES